MQFGTCLTRDCIKLHPAWQRHGGGVGSQRPVRALFAADCPLLWLTGNATASRLTPMKACPK
eukprot:2831957-Amphidinium_carterae.1